MELKRILDEHEDFIRSALKTQDEIIPMIIISKDNKRMASLMIGAGREDMKHFLDKMNSLKPDWLVFLGEGYMEKHNIKGKTKEEKDQITNNYEHGTLEMQFKMGNPKVVEIIHITAYSPDGKLQRTISKKGMKSIYGDIENFEGYLSISDVDRVFWKSP